MGKEPASLLFLALQAEQARKAHAQESKSGPAVGNLVGDGADREAVPALTAILAASLPTDRAERAHEFNRAGAFIAG